jgi:hypothetical protein
MFTQALSIHSAMGVLIERAMQEWLGDVGETET